MLIFEIALGIVLAVLILRFLPALLSFGFLAIIVGGTLLSGAVIVSFAIDNQKDVMAIGVLLGFGIFIWLCAKFLQRKLPHLCISDLVASIVIFLFLALWFAVAIGVEGNGKWILIFPIFLFGLGFGLFIYFKNKKLLSEWKSKMANEEKLVD